MQGLLYTKGVSIEIGNLQKVLVVFLPQLFPQLKRELGQKIVHGRVDGLLFQLAFPDDMDSPAHFL